MREYEYRAQHTAQSITQTSSKQARKRANKNKNLYYMYSQRQKQKLCSLLTETTQIPTQTLLVLYEMNMLSVT